jgi:hypothetical protein
MSNFGRFFSAPLNRIGRYRFLFSTIALVYGWIKIISFCSLAVQQAERQLDGQAQPSTEPRSMQLVGGIYIIIGTLSYRSCKRRKMGVWKTTIFRVVPELIGVALVVVHPFWHFHPAEIQSRPIVPILIPLWVLIAYIIASVRKQEESEKPQD